MVLFEHSALRSSPPFYSIKRAATEIPNFSKLSMVTRERKVAQPLLAVPPAPTPALPRTTKTRAFNEAWMEAYFQPSTHTREQTPHKQSLDSNLSPAKPQFLSTAAVALVGHSNQRKPVIPFASNGLNGGGGGARLGG
jgi:hypothetical protein